MNEPKEQKPDDVIAEITVRMLRNGDISVLGPLQDKVLCFGLLECAKNIAHEHKPKVEQPVPAAGANA